MQFDIVFEGGGAKGMVFVGALKALESRGHTINRLVGTSAGAITATLLSVGYSADELAQALAEKDSNGEPVFARFMDVPTADDFSRQMRDESATMQLFRKIDIPVIPNRWEDAADRKIISLLLNLKAYPVIFSFVERGGLYVGNAFVEWLQKKLSAKDDGYAGMTLLQLHDATGRDLSVVASDTTGRNLLVLNHRTAPNVPVVWAVRMSMSIPFAWQEVIWQDAWNPYQLLDASGLAVDSELDLTDHTVVDGGVLSNFPINLLTSDESSTRAVMGDTQPDRTKVLGMLIDETLGVPGAPPPPNDSADDRAGVMGDIKKLRLVQRVTRLVETMRGAHDNQLITANKDLICRLPAQTYGTMEFDMSDQRRDKLVAAGKRAMEDHLASR